MDTLTFEQRLVLAVLPIVVTAILAGLLAPLLLKVFESRKAIALKHLEAALARQAKLIEAQAGLLDELTQGLWNWRYQVMRVSHAGTGADSDALAAAWAIYDAACWASLNAIRVQTSRARRLVSQSAHQELLRLYQQIVDLDRRLSAAMALDGEQRRQQLAELNQEVYQQLSEAIDEALHRVATEVRLVSAEAER
jgi:hypothetical protein